ncbi:Holliday junction resolvase RuvX [bacterium]|nr:Holliday junction resolvase RuvX [bacterium]
MMIPDIQPVWCSLDTGNVRCGLAVADASATLASPLAVIPTEPRDTLGARIGTALADRQARGLIVGLPLELSGREGPSAQLARELGAAVGRALGCEVIYLDERFTTAEMHVRRREAGVSGLKRRHDIDAWAAATILQGFLDRRPRG